MFNLKVIISRIYVKKLFTNNTLKINMHKMYQTIWNYWIYSSKLRGAEIRNYRLFTRQSQI